MFFIFFLNDGERKTVRQSRQLTLQIAHLVGLTYYNHNTLIMHYKC